MKIGIAIPTYNEALNIESLIEEIDKVLLDVNTHTFYVLIIDDNSPDGTGLIADNLSKKHTRTNFSVNVLHRKIKNGLGRAYVEGFQKLLNEGCDYVLQMDADHSHNPIYIPTFLSKIPEFQLIIGSRYVKGGGVLNWTASRKLISSLGNFFARTVIGIKIQDGTGGFNMYSKEILNHIDLNTIISNGYCFILEMKYRSIKAGAKVAEFPIIFTDRIAGSSKISKKYIFEAFFLAIKLRLLGHA